MFSGSAGHNAYSTSCGCGPGQRAGIHVEVRGQAVGVSSVLQPCIPEYQTRLSGLAASPSYLLNILPNQNIDFGK